MTLAQRNRAPLLAFAAILVVAASGCAGLRADWYPVQLRSWESALEQLPERHREHPAVILRREQHIKTHFTEDSHTEWLDHALIRVMTEAGIDALATYAFRSRDGAELVDYGARTIGPGGEVRDLEGVEVYTDETTVEGEVIEQTFFRIPGVEVGSTVEIWSVTRTDGIPSVIREIVPRGLPTLRYDLTLDVDADLEFEYRVYNMDAQPRMEKLTKGKRIRLRLDDLPAHEDESYGPDGSISQPWWLLGIRRFGTWRTTAYDWDNAVRWIAQRAFEGGEEVEAVLDEPDLDLDDEGCAHDRCRVARALAFVREAARYSGEDEWYRSRPVSEVLASGYADNHEKAYLLFSALDELGLEPRLAMVNTYLSRGHDFEMPSYLWFDHQVVVLERGPGLPEGAVLDPSCEHCLLGQLPAATRGQKGLVYEPVSTFGLAGGRFEVDTEWIDLEGEPPPASLDRRVLRLSLRDDQTFSGEMERQWRGGSAGRVAEDDRDDDDEDRRHSLVSDKDARFARAELGGTTLRSCDRARGRCREGYEVTGRGLALHTPERIIVPLALLHTEFDEVLAEDERLYDLMVRFDHEEAEEVHLKVPPGYELDEAPPDQRVASDAFLYELSIRPTREGAVITRSVHQRRGRHAQASYDELRAPLRAYRDASRELLAFRRRR